MNSRWFSVLLVVVVVVAGVLLWRQQQEIARLKVAGPGSEAPFVTAPVANIKIPPVLSTIDLTFDISGMPSRGAADAPVVMLEFSDFECPYCGKYMRDTYPRIQSQFVDSGQVRYVFSHFPLESLHPHAVAAAGAAVCAQAQGKFWEMHDLLFQHQTALDPASLQSYGDALRLDASRYRACLAADHLAERNPGREQAVRADFSGTPGYVFGRVDASGVLRATRRVAGAQPFSLFEAAIRDVAAGR